MSVTPVSFEADYVEPRNRLTTFFRLILVIPHAILLAGWGVAVFFVVILAWFALLFTGRWPYGLYQFTAAYARYSTYVYGYLGLLTDRYPPFSGDEWAEFPVRLGIGEPKTEYNRLSVAFRIILLIPVLIIMYAMQLVWEIGAFIGWFAILVLGRQPRGLQEMIELGLSYQQRGYAYALLLDDRFPGFTSPTPVLPEGPGGAPSLPPTSETRQAPTAPEAPRRDPLSG